MLIWQFFKTTIDLSRKWCQTQSKKRCLFFRLTWFLRRKFDCIVYCFFLFFQVLLITGWWLLGRTEVFVFKNQTNHYSWETRVTKEERMLGHTVQAKHCYPSVPVRICLHKRVCVVRYTYYSCCGDLKLLTDYGDFFFFWGQKQVPTMQVKFLMFLGLWVYVCKCVCMCMCVFTHIDHSLFGLDHVRYHSICDHQQDKVLRAICNLCCTAGGRGHTYTQTHTNTHTH